MNKKNTSLAIYNNAFIANYIFIVGTSWIKNVDNGLMANQKNSGVGLALEHIARLIYLSTTTVRSSMPQLEKLDTCLLLHYWDAYM